jgi:hypothetical protein
MGYVSGSLLALLYKEIVCLIVQLWRCRAIQSRGKEKVR